METILFPRKIVCGGQCRLLLAENLPPEGTVMFVCGGHATKNVVPELTATLGGRETVCFSAVRPELPLPDIDAILELGRRHAVTAIVAVGGGSVIDAGKLAAALLPLPGTVEDYFFGRREIGGKGVFFAALPTTAGTGAECTPNSVVYDPESGLKQSVRHAEMLPDLALVDFELTMHTPEAITTASGLDALTQALESALSRRHTPFTFAVATEAAELIMRALPRAVNDDPDARSDMARGSMMAGLAFAQSGLGAVHGLAHPLGAVLHIPHGMACAILLTPLLRCNAAYAENLAARLGFAGTDEFIGAIGRLCRRLGVPENFRDYNLTKAHYPFVIKNCRSGSMKCNPRDLSDEDIISILEALT